MALTDRIQSDVLRNLTSFGGAMGLGGLADIGPVESRARALLGGDRQAISQAMAPEMNQALEAAGMARNQAPQIGGRTGGATAANATAGDRLQSTLTNLTFQGQQQGAGQLQQLSDEQFRNMQQALSTAGNIAQSDINSRRAARAAMLSSLIGGVADVATAGIPSIAKAVGGIAKGVGGLFGRGGNLATQSGQIAPPTINPFPGGNPQFGPFGTQTPAGIPYPVSPNLSIPMMAPFGLQMPQPGFLSGANF